MNINEYFGTLLQSVTETHKQHLMTGKYSNHKALNEFYDEMPGLVDALVEHYQGEHGKVENYKNMIEAEGKDPITYLEELLKFTKDGQKELFANESGLSSDIDSIMGQIDSTLYQLKELKEERKGMVPLYEYLSNHMLMEAFQSDIMRSFWMGFQKKARTNGWRSWCALQWDKITDNDLVKLTKDEAIKRMRSQKNPGYLFWVDDSEHTRYGYGENETYHYNGITYGCDVIMTCDGVYKDVKAIHIANDADYAYEVKDPQRFWSRDLQQARREAREGALALQDPISIRDKNIERYKNALAKMRTPEASNLVPKFEEIAEMYKKVFDKYVTVFVGKMQEDSPSYVLVGGALGKVNEMFIRIMDRMASIKNYHEKESAWAQRSFAEFNQKVAELEKYINDYLSKVD